MRGRVVTFMHILFCTFLKHTVNLAQTGIRALKKKKKTVHAAQRVERHGALSGLSWLCTLKLIQSVIMLHVTVN